MNTAGRKVCGVSTLSMPATSAPVQVSRTPASQKHPRAPTTGVREAPRHEIAGRKGLCFAAAIYGDLRSASVCFRYAGTTDARQFGGLTGRGERERPGRVHGERQEWHERTALRRG